MPTSPRIRHSQEFLDSAPKRLLKSFSRQLGCLHDSPAAQSIVGKWLGAGGWLSSVQQLSDFEMDVLQYVAPVLPEAVLENIRIAADTDEKFLSTDGIHRDEVLHLLRLLAYDPAHFDKAIDLIHRYVPIGASDSDLALGIFKSLFYMHLSGTDATAKQRAAFLRNMTLRTELKDIELFLAGLNAMLECMHFSSSYTFEFGARKRDFGLTPRTWKEIKDWYWSAIQLASEADKLTALQNQVRKLVAEKFCHLVRVTGMVDEFILLANEFNQDGGWPLGWNAICSTIDTLQKLGGIEAEKAVKKLATLEVGLRPKSLSDRIECYVVPPHFMMYGVGGENKTKDRKDERDFVDKICREIGKELAADIAQLELLLPQLLADDANTHRTYIVGYTLGTAVQDPLDAWALIKSEILKPLNHGKVHSLPERFLVGVFKQNPDAAELILDEVLKLEDLHPYFIWMQRDVGVAEQAHARLLEAVKLDTVPTYTFSNLAYGVTCDNLDHSQFRELLLALCGRDGGLKISCEIVQIRLYSYESPGAGPVPDELKCLGRELLRKISSWVYGTAPAEHILVDIVRACYRAPQDANDATHLCGRLKEAFVSRQASDLDYGQLIATLAETFPETVLDVFVDCPDSELAAYYYFRRNGGHGVSPLASIQTEELLAWALEAPDTRIERLAGVIVPWMAGTNSGDVDPGSDKEVGQLVWTQLALDLMGRASDPVKVLSQFQRSFHLMAVSVASEADTLATRVPLLEALLNNPDERISEWAKDAKSQLVLAIERIRRAELDSSRKQDQRFE